MEELQEKREMKWHKHHKDNVLWGTGIANVTAEVLAKARVCEATLTQGARQERRDETAR